MISGESKSNLGPNPKLNPSPSPNPNPSPSPSPSPNLTLIAILVVGPSKSALAEMSRLKSEVERLEGVEKDLNRFLATSESVAKETDNLVRILTKREGTRMSCDYCKECTTCIHHKQDPNAGSMTGLNIRERMGLKKR